MSDITWDHPQPFTIPITVVASDIDSFGHVNNTVYLRWLTECAWAHSAAVGLPETLCVEIRRGMAVRSIHVDLLASAYEGDELVLGNWLTRVSGLRATRVYQLIHPTNGTTLLRGHVDFVCVNLDNGRPTRMPEAFKQGYVATLDPESANLSEN